MSDRSVKFGLDAIALCNGHCVALAVSTLGFHEQCIAWYKVF